MLAVTTKSWVPDYFLNWGLITGPPFFCGNQIACTAYKAFNHIKMMWDQELKPHSFLVAMAFALFVITRPGLSSQRYIPPPVDANGKEIPHTHIVCYFIYQIPRHLATRTQTSILIGFRVMFLTLLPRTFLSRFPEKQPAAPRTSGRGNIDGSVQIISTAMIVTSQSFRTGMA